MEILLASTNPKKRRELADRLAGLGVRLIGADEVGGLPEVAEDAPTFAGNAELKARAAALHTGRAALADDSGLEVEALGGAPGVRSARFAGEPADDGRNNRLLLERLAGLPAEARGARFVCALALCGPDGRLLASCEGSASGRILEAPRGDGDFGYDPLFLFTEPGHAQTGRTFAELDPSQKSAVSHRGRALAALARALSGLLATNGAQPSH